MEIKWILEEFKTLSSKEVAEKRKSLLQKLKDATPVKTGKARDGWKIEGENIVNEVDYISTLNQGTSKQAPAHFIEKTVLADPDFKIVGSITTPTPK